MAALLSSSHNPPALPELLRQVFGHSGFRAHQQQVCEAAASGRDVLLVMPTGAGKSLCYQLPALALGGAGHGAGLVISPLIALMDDQAGKLEALGLRVARIHSGLSREDARQACRDYLAGALDFLFIAPERMRVPGFPEMLAKRKPALVAIDEAHCISQWGHDFRPDYRTLGQHLPALRPAPIVALTATATPTVQRDIQVQLQLRDQAVFITGFRRDNLHVEVQELSKPQRDEYTVKLLKDASARPAIVYAPSRKAAEELAGKLNKHFPARAYHAGLAGDLRESVQRGFLGGKVEVVVATIAFGMGVDKADVRTVVHTALPGSVEAYYQEIGRAGRDGKPSRTVLLYSFADRKTQEYFLEKSYPERSELERVAKALTEDWVEPESLQRKLKLDGETLARAIEKLLGLGVADQNMNGEVRGVDDGGNIGRWQPGYDAQVNARRSQIDKMMGFAEGHSCRMAALVQHFGDRSDTKTECGCCDVCAPVGGTGRAPSASECETLRAILRAVAERSTSTGKLFTETAVTRNRKEFDEWLGVLARAGLVTIANDTFRTSEGEERTYRKVTITHEGRTPDDATLATVVMRGRPEIPLTKGPGRKAKAAAKDDGAPLTKAHEALLDRMREWRLSAAKEAGKPAFFVFSDAVLRALARACPKSLAEMEQVSGVGQSKMDLYGAAVVGICRGSGKDPITLEDIGSERVKPKRDPNLSPLENRQKIRARANWESRPEPAAKQTPAPAVVPKELTASQKELQARLQNWRLETAREAGLPSFFVLSDTVLREIVVAAPKSLVELSAVRGLGSEKIDRFGVAVVELCRG